MTSVRYYPYKPFREGNEAVHIIPSASLWEAFVGDSALGMALYGAADTLRINSYAAPEGIVLEGSIETINERREKLLRKAPEIAKAAFVGCTWGKDSVKPDQLTMLVKNFGLPARNRQRDTFTGRMIDSTAPFAGLTTWDSCNISRHPSTYEPPLDPRIDKIMQERRALNETPGKKDRLTTREIRVSDIPPELAGALRELTEIDSLGPRDTLLAALSYYADERLRDPHLNIKIQACSLRAQKQARP